MNNLGKCPACGANTYITKKMTLNWLDVFLVLLPTILIFYTLYLLLINIPNSGSGANFGKVVLYITFGATGLVGWLFSKYVKKQRFKVENCYQCGYKTTVLMTEGKHE